MNGYLTGPQNTQLLDRLLAENQALDAQLLREMAEQRLRERNEELFTRAVRQWFAKTEQPNG